MRLTQLLLVVAAATLVLLIAQFILEVYLNYEEPWLYPMIQYNTSDDISQIFQEISFPVMIWWKPPLCHKKWYEGKIRKCGQLTCFFTSTEQLRNHPDFQGYLFYGTYINWTALPLPRGSETWGLLHEESPRNNIPLVHPAAISLFNYTATFSRHSHYPTTTQFLPDINSITDLKYFRSAHSKNRFQIDESWLLAPVIYIQSSCSTPNNRDEYVLELSKYIRIDSFGKCLHNRTLPPHLQIPFNLKTMMAEDLLYIVGKYKFALAIENAVCEDYVTEKLWRPLIAGTVPIYLGAPNVADWLPNNRSAILGMDFDSPELLAEYLHHLDSDDDEYDSYRSHKLESSVTNTRLIEEVKRRSYVPKFGITFMKEFECAMCEKAHSKNAEESSIASTKHFSCEIPTSLVSLQPNITNIWLDMWFTGRCEAKVVRKFVDSGLANYTVEEFNKAVEELAKENKCSYSEENAREMNLEQLENYRS